MRSTFIALLLLLPFFTGGCALPRAFMLADYAHREAPVPPASGSRRLKMDIQPWALGFAQVRTVSETPMSPKECYSMYYNLLVRHGWQTSSPADISDDEQLDYELFFERKIRCFPKMEGGPTKDTLSLDITRNGSGSTITITIHPHFLIDVPTLAIYYPLARSMGEGALSFATVFLPF